MQNRKYVHRCGVCHTRFDTLNQRVSQGNKLIACEWRLENGLTSPWCYHDEFMRMVGIGCLNSVSKSRWDNSSTHQAEGVPYFMFG